MEAAKSSPRKARRTSKGKKTTSGIVITLVTAPKKMQRPSKDVSKGPSKKKRPRPPKGNFVIENQFTNSKDAPSKGKEISKFSKPPKL